jgi:hypothetical protein
MDLPRVLGETQIDLPTAAKILGKANFTIGQWVRKGVTLHGRTIKLEAVRVGHHWTTSREAVVRFLAEMQPKEQTARTVSSPARLKRKAARARAELERILAKR